MNMGMNTKLAGADADEKKDMWDFIVVGAGTSGALLAYTLSHSPTSPPTLLLEAGPRPSGPYLTAPFHRYAAAALRPDLDHAYTTAPEPLLAGRRIAYTRGRGLGGCSTLNYGVWLRGGGRIMRSGGEGIEALVGEGERVCKDPNDGDPVGVSVFPASYGDEGRCTSASAHLADARENLDVWTEASVTWFLWSADGERVVGVQLQDGRRVYVSKEVILCAGAIDSPRLLLVNGIGPRAELERVGVAVKKDLPGVGKHLQDHVLTFMSVEVDGALNERWAFESNEQLVREATAQWDKDKTGPLTLHHSCLWGGFLKHPDLASFSEYAALPAATQQFLAKPDVPTYEFINNCVAWPPGVQIAAGNSYMTFIAFLMNPQSEGAVTLQSTTPTDAPVIQLNFLTHPYDARIMREAVRAVWTKIALNPTLQRSIKRTLCGPASLADDDVDAFVRDHANSVARQRDGQDGPGGRAGHVCG
ncbi:alcohol oxidase [Lizonia empirigonia]|nr:alcohol oxidase [Lizonia empirigonia]